MSESGYWRMYGSDRSPLLHGVALGGELELCDGDGKHGRVRVSHALFWVAL